MLSTREHSCGVWNTLQRSSSRAYLHGTRYSEYPDNGALLGRCGEQLPVATEAHGDDPATASYDLVENLEVQRIVQNHLEGPGSRSTRAGGVMPEGRTGMVATLPQYVTYRL